MLQQSKLASVTFVFGLGWCSIETAPCMGQGGCEPTETAKLVALDAATDDNFAHDVAISADTAVVGDLYKEVAGQESAGAAYIFARSESTGQDTWTQFAVLTAPNPQTQDWFGQSVAIQGNTIVVGAPGRDVDGMTNAGVVYLYSRSEDARDNAWVLEATLIASDPTSGAVFGDSVAMSGNSLAIGAYPAVYVFVHTEDGWFEQAKLVSPDGSEASVFGHAVAIVNDTLAVGDPRDEVNGLDYAGTAPHLRAPGRSMETSSQADPSQSTVQ